MLRIMFVMLALCQAQSAWSVKSNYQKNFRVCYDFWNPKIEAAKAFQAAVRNAMQSNPFGENRANSKAIANIVRDLEKAYEYCIEHGLKSSIENYGVTVMAFDEITSDGE
jgi:hypothetical protein